MTQLRWIAVSLIAAFPLAALAQPSPQQPADPLDPKAPVTAPGYVSAFAGYVPATVGTQASPDKAWRAANDNVAKSAGHAGHAPANEAAQVDHSKHSPAPDASKKADSVDHSKHSEH
ncbi:hypothetical protein [Massilia cavernae]|uniref:hypothetical protein n=1 Tax=Massilia cavernae TaxID=2320864 RepID=UPI0011C42769|nr:hypothetical protein [Massilia cavernae]